MENDLDSLLDSFSSLTDETQESEVCSNCRGEGFIGRACPVCGKVSEEVIVVKKKEVTKYKRTSLNFIPTDYSLDWTEAEAKKGMPHSPSFLEMIDVMKTILGNICNNVLPDSSLLICAPTGTSKKTWAYTCMKKAEELGYTVAPLIDTMEFKRLATLASERPKYKLYNAIEYDDYINADLLILSVVKDQYCTEAFAPILSILDKRSRLDKATIILSSLPSDILSRRDFTKSFRFVLEKGKRLPSKKFPQVVEYFEEDY